MSNRVRKGAFFLTSEGAPYECRWRQVGTEQYETLALFLSLKLLDAAMAEAYGKKATRARLKDLSAFYDPVLNSLLELLHREVMAQETSPLAVEGLAQTVAIHLARHFGRPAAVGEALQHPHNDDLARCGRHGVAQERHR